MLTRWAILGTGYVARKFVLGLRQLGPAAQVATVASRDPARAAAFVSALAPGARAMDYAAALADPEVDAVYIALPPDAHEPLALAAIAAGKALLIEKPFASDAASARRITAAAQAAGTICLEAMWTRYMPMAALVDRTLAGDALGEIRSLEASFAISNRPETGGNLFDPAAGGGALMHRGVYGISLARRFLGPVRDVTARARLGDTGVDEDCTVILTHASGALSTVTASLRAAARNDLAIAGTRGRLALDGPLFRPTGATLWRYAPRTGATGTAAGRLEGLREGGLAQRLNQGLPSGLKTTLLRAMGRGPRRLRAPYAGNGYHYQAAELARLRAANETASPQMPLSETLEVMDILDTARAQFAPKS